jgi:enamine deaminase RidA (YjgF/YER057c/UK114 family)
VSGAGERAHPALETIAIDGWAPAVGYANGVAASGRIVFVAGQIAWDPRTLRLVSPDLVEQAAQALRNVCAVLAAAGAEPRHVARLTWYVTDRAAYLAGRPALGRAWRELFGRHYPAMSVVFVSALLEEGALVEVEATAVVPEQVGRPTRSLLPESGPEE